MLSDLITGIVQVDNKVTDTRKLVSIFCLVVMTGLANGPASSDGRNSELAEESFLLSSFLISEVVSFWCFTFQVQELMDRTDTAKLLEVCSVYDSLPNGAVGVLFPWWKLLFSCDCL